MLRLPAFLTRVASEYDALPHVPHDATVRVCYDALCEALDAQFATLSGLVDIRFTAVDPYPTAQHMFNDVGNHSRLYVFTGSDMPDNHPLQAGSRYGFTYNELFRAIHDGLAHFPERNNFSAYGEFRAFRAHCRLLAGNVRAMHALATETLGQNAWCNFGEVNRNLEQVDQRFAEQKAGLLPWSTVRQALTEVTV
jgi:hypothetical protein